MKSASLCTYTNKTDNSFLAEKIKLRVDNLPDKSPIFVLDMFSGDGLLWDYVRQQTGRDIQSLRIDVASSKKGIYIVCDNLKLNLDYTRFDVIDLDAFGIPYAPLAKMLPYLVPGQTTFVTFIQSGAGQLPKKMLIDLGYTAAMQSKIPTLFNRHGTEKFFAWLTLKGVKRISFYQGNYRNHPKIYLCFRTCTPANTASIEMPPKKCLTFASQSIKEPPCTLNH